MAEFVRLFGRMFLRTREGRKVEQITFRVRATVPGGAKIRVADLQAQPGALVTGWTLHTLDLGLQDLAGWELRNGVMRGAQVLVVTADTEQASPLRVDAQPLNGAATVRVGAFHYGRIAGAARVDGPSFTASQGAGLPPHLTARADVDLTLDQPPTGRSRVLVWFRGITTIEDDDMATPLEPPEEPTIPGPEPEPEDEDDTPDPNDPPDPGEDEEEEP